MEEWQVGGSTNRGVALAVPPVQSHWAQHSEGRKVLEEEKKKLINNKVIINK